MSTRSELAAVLPLAPRGQQYGAAGQHFGGFSEGLPCQQVSFLCRCALSPARVSSDWLRPGSDVVGTAARHVTGLALAVYIEGGRYDYMTLSGQQHVKRLSCDWTERDTLSHVQVTLPVCASSVV